MGKDKDKEKGKEKAEGDTKNKKGSQIRKELPGIPISLSNSSEKSVTIAPEPPSPHKNSDQQESSLRSTKPPPQERKEGFKKRKGSFPSLTSFFQKKSNSGVVPIPVHLSKKSEEEEEEYVEKVVEFHQPEEDKEENKEIHYSVKLRSLIDERKDPELYRKTILWIEMAVPNNKKIEQLESFPWHTAQNLITLLDAKLRKKLIKKQLLQIDLLGQLCDDILEPALQRYLQEVKYDAKQVESFCNYLQRSIETTMDSNLLAGYPLLTEQLKYGHRKKVMPEEQLFTVEDKEKLNEEELTFRAKFHLNCWQLIKAGKNKQLNIIIPYVIAVIAETNEDKYHSILEELLVATAKVNILSRKLDLNTKAIATDLEQRHPPRGYVGLSTHLSLDPLSKVEIIQKLAKFFHSQKSDNLPECSLEEVDFFFAEGSTSLNLVQTKIVDFMRENIKLCKVGDGSISPRNRDSFTNRLVNELKEVLAPEKVEKTSRNLCF